MLPACSSAGFAAISGVGTWKDGFFFLELSAAPWPCPVEWGEPSRSSTMDPALTVDEKVVAENLLCARGISPIDLSTYLHDRNMAAAKIIGAPPSRPPTPQGGRVIVAMDDIQAEKAVPAAAPRASAGKVTVKSEPDCKVPPCALSLGKKRKLEKDRAADGESSASDPCCPPGFSTLWKPPSTTSNDGKERQCALQQDRDGDWKTARRLLQGTVTPSRARQLAASKPADVVASSYVSLLQAANEVAFSLGHALELEQKLRAREREADALREELGRKTKALEHDGAVADALRAELRKAKANLAETKADAERAERRGYERGMEDMKRATLRRYPKLDPARLVVPLHGPPLLQ
ncbi:hypothetical protein ZWY2020_050364 [Hordeum vulgare]|nr:hypothetical protein ZWY2020_050364 [Hordeum vulgare]